MEPKAIGLTDAQLRASPVAVSGTFALPAGGATEAKQDQEIALLTARLPSNLGAGGGLKIDGSSVALPVSAASLPLPAGGATSALQSSQITLQQSCNTLLGAGLPTSLGTNGELRVGIDAPLSAFGEILSVPNTPMVQLDDLSATALSGGDAILAFTLGKVESRFIDAVPIDLVINPGEILTVSVKSTANVPAADVSAALSWTEA